eukprot:scaffold214364_cov23-Cyclotella_meneghiniana.AAC.1
MVVDGCTMHGNVGMGMGVGGHPKSTAEVKRWELKVARERGLTFGTHPCCPPKFQPPCKGVNRCLKNPLPWLLDR